MISSYIIHFTSCGPRACYNSNMHGEEGLDYINSPSKVLSVCTILHVPFPTADTALTLTLYSVPASSPVRIVEVAGGETELVYVLFQEVVPFLLYCTW